MSKALPARAVASPASIRAELVAIAQRMSASGLSPGKSGNISARVHGGILITPTGMPFADLRAIDIVEMRLDGRTRTGQRAPSSEWPMHLAVYHARGDVHAIVHTHSLNATALACLHREIPPFHYMVAVTGGDRIACAPYATYGSEVLAKNAVKALGPRNACLLANHGALAVGENLRATYDLAWEVETLASQYVRTLQLGRPKLLTAREMARVLDKFKTYGKQTPVKDAAKD